MHPQTMLQHAQQVKRTCCQIVDNMCKLVEDPAEVLCQAC